MGARAAVVGAERLALDSMWVAPTMFTQLVFYTVQPWSEPVGYESDRLDWKKRSIFRQSSHSQIYQRTKREEPVFYQKIGTEMLNT
jgi:hypothetical protein